LLFSESTFTLSLSDCSSLRASSVSIAGVVDLASSFRLKLPVRLLFSSS
jgi:hypothetical protein